MLFTVFGIYPDNNQRHCDTVEATNPGGAEEAYRELHGEGMLIAATIEGDHTPADGKTYAHE